MSVAEQAQLGAAGAYGSCGRYRDRGNWNRLYRARGSGRDWRCWRG